MFQTGKSICPKFYFFLSKRNFEAKKKVDAISMYAIFQIISILNDIYWVGENGGTLERETDRHKERERENWKI